MKNRGRLLIAAHFMYDEHQHHLEPMNYECIHCKALHCLDESTHRSSYSFYDCCAHGKVVLDSLPEYPDDLRKLFSLRHLRNKCRVYNNMMAFASFQANLMDFGISRPGPYCFKLHGQILYNMNAASFPKDIENATFGQQFMIDEKEAVKQRIENARQNSKGDTKDDIKEEIVTKLTNIISRINVHAESYRMMNYQKSKKQTNDDM
ncbi:hypothetical protein L798_05072 [Zootermopsis nevadensis]|uniref:Uncharacterized protein n=1 Tax=Zootermopsis nevadensis TaxID=136037 RepID=A0A067QFE6_ZOONE|nr:hypothetical protein L798_05072 [Zootermopsis nevadensis]